MMVGIVAFLSLIVSSISLVVAIISYLLSRSSSWTRALLLVVERLENEELRGIRRDIIYSFPRGQDTLQIKDLSEDEVKKGVDRWGAEMDILGLLLASRAFDRTAFFDLYGDVVIRSTYLLAQYANAQRRQRGEQFWIRFQKLAVEMVIVWRRRGKRLQYPRKIGVPNSDVTLTADTVLHDHDVRQFLEANSQRIPSA